MPDIFTYEIHKGDLISRWMLSPLKEEHYRSRPEPYPSSYGVNMPWREAVSPVRVQYVEEKPFEREEEEFLPCGEVYFPFETEKVERSAFWKLPTKVTFGAQLELETAAGGEYPFRLMTCGGAKVFVNGEKQAEFYSYLRNEERETECSVTLKQGKNTLYILTNELAERDTSLSFKLRYMGEQSLKAYLPCAADLEALDRTRKLLSGIYLRRFNYQDTDIELDFTEPAGDELTVSVEMVFYDSHADPVSREKTVTIHPGEKAIPIGDLVSEKVGMVAVTVRTCVGDVKLNRVLNFEYYDETAMPDSGIGTTAERKQAAIRFMAENGLDNLAKALALRIMGGQEALVKRIWEKELSCIRQREDCADFRLPALFHAYHSPLFTGEEKESIKQVLLDFRYWTDEPGNDVMWFFSENHALLFHTAEYLAGGLFEQEIFTNSGMTGTMHKRKAERLLKVWFRNFLSYGFNEWNSPVYIPIDMTGFFALYDLASDEEIRKLAKKALDKAFSIFGINSFKGIVAASYGRIYFKNLIGRRTSESTALNFIANGEGYLGQHTLATLMFALSSYEPPAEVMESYHVPAEGRITESAEGEEKVHLYSYRTPDYVMGSVLDYHPGEPGSQEHVLQVMIKDCDTQIWINHPGEAVYFGEGRPGYFAGNGTLPLIRQDKNLAVAEFHLLDQEVQYTHAFCPLEQFSEWRLEGRWLFLKKDNICAAVYADNGIWITDKGPLKNYELVSPGKDNVWKILVEEESVYGSFEKFIHKLHQNGGKER